MKKCNFDFQLYIQTQKVSPKQHIDEIKKCVRYEPELSEMANDYMNLINEITEVRGSISRKFFIIISHKEQDRKNKIMKVIDGLKSCGNIAEVCSKKEILKVIQSCFKKISQDKVALGY